MKQFSTLSVLFFTITTWWWILATCCIHFSNCQNYGVPMVKTINPGTNYLRNFVEVRHARLEHPVGICHMPNGDYFISSSNYCSCTIRKVSKADGKIYPYAEIDYQCDQQNKFNPEWIQCDPSNGELYVLANNEIRKITQSSVSTIAGGPFKDFTGIHYNYLTREMFMISTTENKVIKVNVDTGNRQDVTQVEKPRGITQSLTSGTLYISTENHVIYKIENNQLSVFCGSLGQNGYKDGTPSQSLFYNPYVLFYDNQQNELIINDFGNARIRKFKTNTITTITGNGYKGFSGDGLATGVSIDQVLGMSINGDDGELLFIDGSIIRKLSNDNLYLETIMPNKVVDVFESDYKNAAFTGREIAINSKNEIFVLNEDSGVFKFSNGIVSNVVDFTNAKNIAINSKDELFVGSDSSIFKISSSGQKEHFALDGPFPKTSHNNELNHVNALLSVIDPCEMAISDDLSNIYFVESSQRIRKFDLKTNIIRTIIGDSVNLPIEQPYALITGPDNSLYFSQLASSIISKYTTTTTTTLDGKIETIAGVYHTKGYSSNGKATESLIGSVHGLYLKDNTFLYISDTSNNLIRMIDLQSGIISNIAGDIIGRPGYQNGDSKTALFNSPSGIVVLQNGDIIVADTGNHVLRKIDSNNGLVSLFAGEPGVGNHIDGPIATATLYAPEKIELLSNNDILLVDSMVSTIRKISQMNGGGMVSTIAGIAGNLGFSGDGKQALKATLSSPASIKVDKNGDIYCSDRGNLRIRKISQMNGIIQTIAGGRGDFIQAKKAIALVSEITFNENDEMIIADLNSIRKINKNGIISTIVGNGENSFGQFCQDGTKSNNCPLNPTTAIQYCSQYLYFIELYKLRFVKSDSTIQTINSNVKIKHIACQKETGKLLVASANSIYLLDSNNELILLSGNVQNNDDGPFKSLTFNDPVFATSPSGQLIISEPPTTSLLNSRRLNNLRIVDCGLGYAMNDFSTCVIDTCEGEFGICNGNGKCNLIECKCDSNYRGKQCEIMLLSKVIATFTKSNIRTGSSPDLEIYFNDQDFLKYYSGRYLYIEANLLNERNEHVENIRSKFHIYNETQVLINGKDFSKVVGEFNVQVEIRDELTGIIVASKVKVLNQLTTGEIGGNGAAVAFAVIFALLSFGLGGALISLIIIIIKKRLFSYKPTAYEMNDEL